MQKYLIKQKEQCVLHGLIGTNELMQSCKLDMLYASK